MNPDATWLPKSVVCLRYYNLFRLRSDLIAAAAIALDMFPVCVAMSIICGVALSNGVYGAMIAGLLSSLLGGTKIQISAPNLAALTLASSIVSRGGAGDLFLTTMMVGAVLLFLATTGLGAAVRFIPQAVVTGITTGLAVLILAGLLPSLLGLKRGVTLTPGSAGAAALFSMISVPAVLVASVTLILMIFGAQVSRFIPAGLLAMAIAALFVQVAHIPVHVIGGNYGAQTARLNFLFPMAHSEHLDLSGSIIAEALAIAVLMAIESVAAEQLATSLTGERQRPRLGLLVDGAANVVCAFVGGLPASGDVSYTAANAQYRAQTPVAGIIQSAFQLLLLLLIAPFAGLIPLPAMAAILLSRVFSMPHWRKAFGIMRLRNTETGAWLATTLLTLATPFPMAMACGMLISMSLLMRQRRVAGGA